MFECECTQFRFPPVGARDMMFSFGIKSRLLLLSTKCFIYFPMGLLWRFTVNRNRLISRTPCPRDRDLPNTLYCHNTLFITWNRDENKPIRICIHRERPLKLGTISTEQHYTAEDQKPRQTQLIPMLPSIHNWYPPWESGEDFVKMLFNNTQLASMHKNIEPFQNKTTKNEKFGSSILFKTLQNIPF